MPLEDIRALVQSDLDATDRLIQQHLQSSIPLIQQLSQYILQSGGKRLRPILILLSAQTFASQSQKTILLAAIIELIHTATLLHDDVVDTSELRRGRQTANVLWGNPASVLVGDYLYSRAFQMMVELNNTKMLEILAAATNTIAEGEIMQLMNCNNPQTSEADYLQVLRHKTGTLFEVAARLTAVLCERTSEEIEAMSLYGMSLGIAFQLIDDALDYNASNSQLGKNIGDDLAEGKPTLPLIYALRNIQGKQRELIYHAIANGEQTHLASILEAVETSGAITYTYQIARQYITTATHALLSIPPSPYREALQALANFTINRSY